ncbi:MAG: HpcH/HpaI aldolase/citrate lyase family protein [Spirochaetaceae bacterium]|nr:HpcH/HpaI aldolase/citrate lyase family protein [Spirochaetaceae bacterium]
MSGPSRFLAGAEAKSDCLAAYEPGDSALEIEVSSKVGTLFGKAIRAAAAAAAAEFGAGGRLSIRDDGALDYVVAARVEAALRDAGLSRAPAAGRPVPRREPSSRGRLRRTRLYLPGDQPDLPINAGLFGADSILVDLEDSVAPERKAATRILARRLLESHADFFGSSEIAVRVNPLAESFGAADLEEIVPARPQALVLPKCESAEDVAAYDREVSRLEAAAGLPVGSILFMPIVETARGVAKAAEIAAASERNAALCFGAEDYRRDLGLAKRPDEGEILVARSLVAIAARAAGIGAQDSVFADTEDEAGLEASTLAAKNLGFTGKGVVHPRQIAVVHRAFAPGAAELEAARRVLAAMAAADGRGVVSLDGKMIDAPVAERARRLVEYAESAERAAKGS